MLAAAASKEISKLVELLPENEQLLAYELVKRLVLAWDSDFSKLTASERERLQQAENDLFSGETVNHNQINWN